MLAHFISLAVVLAEAPRIEHIINEQITEYLTFEDIIDPIHLDESYNLIIPGHTIQNSEFHDPSQPQPQPQNAQMYYSIDNKTVTSDTAIYHVINSIAFQQFKDPNNQQIEMPFTAITPQANHEFGHCKAWISIESIKAINAPQPTISSKSDADVFGDQFWIILIDEERNRPLYKLRYDIKPSYVNGTHFELMQVWTLDPSEMMPLDTIPTQQHLIRFASVHAMKYQDGIATFSIKQSKKVRWKMNYCQFEYIQRMRSNEPLFDQTKVRGGWKEQIISCIAGVIRSDIDCNQVFVKWTKSEMITEAELTTDEGFGIFRIWNIVLFVCLMTCGCGICHIIKKGATRRKSE